MGGHFSHLRHDGLLKDLRYVGSHHDGPDVLQLRLVLALVLRQGHQSPVVQVLGDGLWIPKQAEDLGGDLLREAMSRIARFEDGAVEAIGAESFVEVGGPHRLLDI